MVRLVLDTSFNYLHLYLMDEQHSVLDGISLLCPKRQSESIMPQLNQLCLNNNVLPQMIKEVVVADGPGSYTGLRIALTIAKVLAIDTSVRVATICSLDLVFGMNGTGYAIMDARANRLYMAHYTENKRDQLAVVDKNEWMASLHESDLVFGQGSLIGKSDVYADLKSDLPYMESRLTWVDNVFQVKPRYLKENDAYDPNKKS